MGVKFKVIGDLKKTHRFLNNAQNLNLEHIMRKYGEIGVWTLRNNTPKDTGLTANSWEYGIEIGPERSRIYWYNTNDAEGWFNVAIAIQYGHATGTGGWVEGIDFINPAIQGVFYDLANAVWKEVTNS